MKPCPANLDPVKWARQQAIVEQNRKAIADELAASNSRPHPRDIAARRVSPPLVVVVDAPKG